MRRTAVVAILVVALVAVMCPIAMGQEASASPSPDAPTGAAIGSGFSFAVILIGILVAIALPTFLGARARANDRAAQSSLRNGLAAAKTYFTDGDTYAGFDPEMGRQIEPSLSWIGSGAPAGPTTVAIVEARSMELLLVSRSEGGTFFCLYDDALRGTTYGQGPTYAAVDSAAECVDPMWP